MSVFYSTELAGIAALPVVKADSYKAYGSRLKRYRATITMAAQDTTDTIVIALVPAGSTFAFGLMDASATVGAAATLAIGTADTPELYRVAAIHTTADVPEMFGTTAAVGAAPLTATQTVIVTIAEAAVAAAGTLVIDLFFTTA